MTLLEEIKLIQEEYSSFSFGRKLANFLGWTAAAGITIGMIVTLLRKYERGEFDSHEVGEAKQYINQIKTQYPEKFQEALEKKREEIAKKSAEAVKQMQYNREHPQPKLSKEEFSKLFLQRATKQ